MPYTVKKYGSFDPYYVKLYGDFGHGLKVIHRRAITETEDVKESEELPLAVEEMIEEQDVEIELEQSKADKMLSTTCLMLAWKSQSKKSTKKRYYLLIEFQGTESNGKVNVYKLFSSKHKEKVEEALQEVNSTLSEIINAPLSEKLLKMLILPKPKSKDQLHKVMSDYVVQTVPKSTSDWNKLIASSYNERSLKRHAVDSTAVGVLREKHGNDLVVGDPITGTTLVHLAVQHGYNRLKKTLEHLCASLTHEEYLQYINRCNKDGFSTVLSPRRQSMTVSVKQFSTSSCDDDASENELTMKSSRSISKVQHHKSTLKVYPFELGAVTALMLAVRKSCVRSVHYLLVGGCNPNYQDPTKGMTALHIAAVMCNVSITKLLLSFDADLTLTDAEGKTPIDVVSEREGDKAEECLVIMERIANLRQKGSVKKMTAPVTSEQQNSLENIDIQDEVAGNQITVSATVHERTEEIKEEVCSKPTQATTGSNGISLLSFDGGGTRGCISAYMLYLIEKRMRLLADNSELKMCNYFNWYAGTNIGSFLALSMSHKKASTYNLMTAIVNNREEIFPGHRIYSSTPLEEFAKRLVGEDDIRSIKEPKVLVTAVKADQEPLSLAFITNYKDESEDERGGWKAWEAVRASTAAPTYFPSFEGTYVDGSILAVVPTLHAMSDIQKDGRKLDFVLSLGTGEAMSGKPLSLDLKISNLKYLSSLLSIATVNTSYTASSTDQARAWCKMINASYHHLSPFLSKSLPIDTVQQEEFVLMFYETYIYCLEIDAELNEIAKTLLELGPK